MSEICTYTGRKVNLIQPEAIDVDFIDVAHALSLNCRFNGHTSTMWSVASHSILVSDMLYREFKDVKLALAGLLHDASECYISDISRPLKSVLTSYLPIEAQIQDTVYEAVGLLGVVRDTDAQQKIREADDLALKAEALKLMIPFKEWEEYLNEDRQRAQEWMSRVKVENPQIVKGIFLLKLYVYMRHLNTRHAFVDNYSPVMERALESNAIPIFEGKEFFGNLVYSEEGYTMERGGKMLEFPKTLLDNSMSVSVLW